MAYCCSTETLELMYHENEKGEDAFTKLTKAKLSAKPCVACRKDVRIHGLNSWRVIYTDHECRNNLGKRVARYIGKDISRLENGNEVICRNCHSDMERREAKNSLRKKLKFKYETAYGSKPGHHSPQDDISGIVDRPSDKTKLASKPSTPKSRIPRKDKMIPSRIHRDGSFQMRNGSGDSLDGSLSEVDSNESNSIDGDSYFPMYRYEPQILCPTSKSSLQGDDVKSQSNNDKEWKDNMSAVELKEQGNRFFANKKYDEAISCYTKAIMKNPQDAKFFTNRALCNMKLKKWSVVIDDCRHAMEIDRSSVKSYFFLGIAQLEQELYDEAIVNLRKAHDLAREQKKNFGDDIACQLRLAKKKRWNVMEEKRINQEIALQEYLNKLMLDDQERRLSEVEKSMSDIGGEEIQRKRTEIEESVNRHRQDLANLFAAIDERRKKRDVPDYLCGKISFELMRDPVITPSGITYDRKDIEQHLQRVGHFDPITRVKLTQEQLIPNLSMKEIITHFLSENEWVEDY